MGKFSTYLAENTSGPKHVRDGDPKRHKFVQNDYPKYHIYNHSVDEKRPDKEHDWYKTKHHDQKEGKIVTRGPFHTFERAHKEIKELSKERHFYPHPSLYEGPRYVRHEIHGYDEDN